MKKIGTIVCLLMATLMVFAAGDVKKVAIMEVEDEGGKLDYSQKLMLRSNMGKAVAQTPGYEAFERDDIDEILKEYEFQTTTGLGIAMRS